jgi:hypothetical protein
LLDQLALAVPPDMTQSSPSASAEEVAKKCSCGRLRPGFRGLGLDLSLEPSWFGGWALGRSEAP